MSAAYAVRQWWKFSTEAIRSNLRRIALLFRGVYVGPWARITGGGRFEFSGSIVVQRCVMLNARTGGVIRVGSGTRIGAFAVISAIELIDIGADVLIADRVFIADHNHEFVDHSRPIINQGATKPRQVRIGSGTWIGINVCIMPGVELGPGCVVGAGCVVTHSFPAGSIVAGVPARLIGQRLVPR